MVKNLINNNILDMDEINDIGSLFTLYNGNQIINRIDVDSENVKSMGI